MILAGGGGHAAQDFLERIAKRSRFRDWEREEFMHVPVFALQSEASCPTYKYQETLGT